VSNEKTVETPAGDWHTQIRDKMHELDQPHLISQIVQMFESHASIWTGELGAIAARNHRINRQPGLIQVEKRYTGQDTRAMS